MTQTDAMTKFIGIDLAWGEGTASKQAKETGLAVIDERGTVLDAGWARGIDAVCEWIIARAEPGDVIAIDAPLVIPNLTGMRLAERQVGMGYGKWKVAANASNQQMGWQGGVALRLRLEAEGLRYTDGLTSASSDTSVFFECYPYTTMVGMAELGYELERPRYKRLVKTLPVGQARELRARECDELIRRMQTLEFADPPVDLASHDVTRILIDEPSPIADVPHKHREDLLDAVLSARTASIWHRHGSRRVQVLGESDAADAHGRIATIVAPARAEQRVKGRAMRMLPADAAGHGSPASLPRSAVAPAPVIAAPSTEAAALTARMPCRCGCGEIPRSAASRYAGEGHDAKHRSRLQRAVLAGEMTEENARAEIGPFQLAEQLSAYLAADRIRGN